MDADGDGPEFPLAAAILAVQTGRVVSRAHVLRRMIERGLDRSAVIDAVSCGEVIEKYLDDSPYPSALVLGFAGEQPLHVVVAFDEASLEGYIITAYQPSPEKFEPDWRTRRQEK